MRVIQWKSSRALRVLAVVFILIPNLYLLYIASKSSDTPNGLFHSSGGAKRQNHGKPRLTESNGNFEPEPEEVEDGPGEGGKPHSLRSDQANDVSQAVSEYGMNMVCSDEISLERAIPDTRLPECKRWVYPTNLPKASVIIVFHNEGWSTLLRTVHTVVKRTPPQFLEEVLMVDDYSDKDHLKEKLSQYIERFDGKVRLIRNTERQGLIRSRSRGAVEARGEVIVFLDAHCEVNANWLPPLLAPIYYDRKTLTVPVIDGIDHDNFEYRPVYQNGRHFRGIFEWGMLYKENELSPEIASQDGRKYNSEPYKSPTHAGGLFAMDRQYFLDLGLYDSGLLVWGGENFELSFKVWQCGGSIYWVPCSRVGHVYRSFMPYNFGKLAEKKKGPLITINYKRVIETWFDDEYKQYFYTREPLAKFLDMGDISEQLELKERLHCKSFKWFMENVAPDLLEKYPALPPNLHWGEVENVGGGLCLDTDGIDAVTKMRARECENTELGSEDQLRNAATQKCIDTMGKGPPAIMGVSQCHGFGNNQALESRVLVIKLTCCFYGIVKDGSCSRAFQACSIAVPCAGLWLKLSGYCLLRLNSKGQLGVGERCIDGDRQGIKLVFCKLGIVEGPWHYDENTKLLLHSDRDKCLTLHPQSHQLSLLPCDESNVYHQWNWKELHPKW